jgi:aminoglycoside phosphotransferase (APT) family kinase protein
MQMHSQQTPESIIAKERTIIQNLDGIPQNAEITFEDYGWDSRVYMIDAGKIVFKFPRTEAIQRHYSIEMQVIDITHSFESNVKTPDIHWRQSMNQYYGYNGIVGTTLDFAGQQSESFKQRLGTELGLFLQQLHQKQLPDAGTITIDDEIHDLHEKYRVGLAIFASTYTATELLKLEQLVFNYLPKHLPTLGFDKVLCHGDLGYWNVVLGADTTIGVIDFGDSGYYDRSKDFIGLADEAALQAALKTYGDNPILRQKITARRHILYFHDLPFFMGKSDQAGIATTLDAIRNLL